MYEVIIQVTPWHYLKKSLKKNKWINMQREKMFENEIFNKVLAPRQEKGEMDILRSCINFRSRQI